MSDEGAPQAAARQVFALAENLAALLFLRAAAAQRGGPPLEFTEEQNVACAFFARFGKVVPKLFEQGANQ